MSLINDAMLNTSVLAVNKISNIQEGVSHAYVITIWPALCVPWGFPPQKKSYAIVKIISRENKKVHFQEY